jgi:predicted transcriptional regulator
MLTLPEREAFPETDAEYLARIDREIAAGLEDIARGDVITEREYRADMTRFMSNLSQRNTKPNIINR